MTQFPMVVCSRCKKRVPAQDTWEYATFSADEGQLTFKLCLQCNKEKGNQNVQDFAASFKKKSTK